MAAIWPATLQQLINEEGFNYKFGETTLRTSTEVGPKKVRRIYSTGTDTQTCTIRISRDQYDLFETFFKTTLNGGASTFLFPHPISTTETEWRFSSPPVISPIGGIHFTVAMEWEAINV